MRISLNFFAICMLAVSMLMTACVKEQDPVFIIQGPYAKGVFISNEGTFGQSNASVSFLSFSGDSIRNNIYGTVNKRLLGQVLQSMYSVNGKVYMVLNLTDTVAVAMSEDFKEAGFVGGLKSPRYMTSINGKGYITQWGEGGVVKVFDLSTNKVLRTIKVGMGPEQAIVAGGNVLVCNGGAYDLDSTISVIDPNTDQVVQTISVGNNPKELVVDKNNDIWVVCYGYIKYDGSFNIILETPSKLVKLSGQTYQKIAEFLISPTQHPQHIDISPDRAMVYYGGGFGFAGIYAMNINASATPAAPIVDGSKYFYGFNVYPVNGEIYALDAADFTSPGVLRRYTYQGNFLKEYTVGVSPNGALFK